MHRNILSGSMDCYVGISAMLCYASCPRIKFLSLWPGPLHLKEDEKLHSRDLVTHNKSFFKKDYKPKPLPQVISKFINLYTCPQNECAHFCMHTWSFLLYLQAMAFGHMFWALHCPCVLETNLPSEKKPYLVFVHYGAHGRHTALTQQPGA